MGLFLICLWLWLLFFKSIWFSERGFIGSISPDDFCGFLFFWNWKKHFDFLQSLRIMYKLHRKMSKRQKKHWLVTWVEDSPPASCRLVVSLLVCQVHQNWKRRGLMYIELNYICISHLWLCFWQMRDTTIGTTIPQLAGDEFSTQVTNQ